MELKTLFHDCRDIVTDTTELDRKIREDALESIRTYLLYKRDLSELDLLKLWRGLFFCKYQRLILEVILYSLISSCFSF